MHGLDTNASFYRAVREAFPAFAGKADRHFLKYWDEQPSGHAAYSWFECVANALNDEMRQDARLSECAEFFDFVARALGVASEEVKRCIDVSLVENLFWRVPPHKSAAYWNALPAALQALYVGFHNKPPV